MGAWGIKALERDEGLDVLDIYLFSVCLFGYSIPEVLEELPRLNSD